MKTAAFPLSNIFSSSSSVVALPAERKSELNPEKTAACSHDETNAYAGALTDLQLSLNATFTPLPEVHLGFVILGHYLHKLPGQDSMLEEDQKKKDFTSEKVKMILKQDHPG